MADMTHHVYLSSSEDFLQRSEPAIGEPIYEMPKFKMVESEPYGQMGWMQFGIIDEPISNWLIFFRKIVVRICRNQKLLVKFNNMNKNQTKIGKKNQLRKWLRKKFKDLL